MALVVLSAEEAAAAAQRNPEAGWPQRGAEPNRLEPVPLPRVDPSFRIAHGARVMTIGACFSRHIDHALAARGMVLPGQAVFKQPEFSSLSARFINNWSFPSIRNEVSWAVGDRPFDEGGNFVEVGPDLYCDLHMNAVLDGAPIEEVRLRRRAALASYAEIKTCDMIIVSLGNSECWYDTRTSLYLNTHPSGFVLSKQPGRFELHALDFDDMRRELSALIDLLKRHCPPHAGILVGVAPWPQGTTHTGQDVLLSTCYARSALRVAIEDVTRNYDKVDYFPIYEAIAYADRSVWKDDYVHIEPAAIEASAARLVRHYIDTGASENDDELVASLNPNAPGVTPEMVFFTFENRPDLIAGRPEVALRFASAAAWLRKLDQAAQALERIPDDFEPVGVSWIRAQILHAQGRHGDVVRTLDPHRKPFRRRVSFWRMLLTGLFTTGEVEAGKAAIKEWASVSPLLAEPYRLGAAFLAPTGDVATTRYMFSKAVSLARDPKERDRLNLDYAEYMASLGRPWAARRLLRGIQPANGPQKARLDDLRLRLRAM
jgi:hypothetical protein